MTRTEYLTKLSEQRVLLLDGAMGTLIQQSSVEEEDFSTYLLDGKKIRYAGFGEILNITRPDIIFDIHNEYLSSGADIITTNTFSANRITLKEYDLQDYVKELNQSAVEIARAAAEMAEQNNKDRFVFVAGSIGPTGKMLSFSTDSEDIYKREFSFNDFKRAYKEQALVLLETRCDIILVETVFDTLVCKAALEGIREAQEISSIVKPIMVSVTFSDISGHTLSGQSLEAFITSLSQYPIFSLGMNCSMGATEMVPLIKKLSAISPFRVSAHPNAGLPLADGTYGESDQQMVNVLTPILTKGLLNIIGGCCGTTSSHIKGLYNLINKVDENNNLICPPRIRKSANDFYYNLCGLEIVEPEKKLIIVGERCNVAGSRKFASLIENGKFEVASTIALHQVENKADVLDICMDSSMIDGPKTMVSFLRYLNSDPYISKNPYMIDSSSWETIESALGEVQGRCIVNSISLKEGESSFLSKAKTINNFGHNMVVMLFDEEGQATTYERKIEIAKRSYNLLISNGISANSIIFDPNILTISTGIEESDFYALDYLKAVSWIKSNLPMAKVCGGVSNLSFSFRGNNALRNAIHTVFIHHASKAGLDFAIINPLTSLDINTVPKSCREIIENAILKPSIENREKLIELAISNVLQKNNLVKKKRSVEFERDVESRIKKSIYTGNSSTLESDIFELLDKIKNEDLSPVTIIEGPLMAAMKIVGEKFGKGELFLPQVVKSARTMKTAVSFIEPAILSWNDNHKENNSSLRKIKVVVFATVEGDVHDIGKNICILVLRCNGFEVIDLGVMVPSSKIVETAIENKANLICLSGLITPSLQKMSEVCNLAFNKKLNIPILVGGATTSEEHTALKLAPLYNYRVFQASNASELSSIALRIVEGGETYINELSSAFKEKEKQVKEKLNLKKVPNTTDYKTAFENRYIKNKVSPTPKKLGITILDKLDIDELEKLINWKMFAFGYSIPPHGQPYFDLLEEAKSFLSTKRVREVLTQSLRGVYGIFPCTSDGLTIIVDDREKFSFARQEKTGITYSLADYVKENDYIGMYIASGGLKITEAKSLFDEGEYVMLQLLAIRLVEALSEYIVSIVEKDWQAPVLSFGPGYPSCPNHFHKQGIFNLLDGENISKVKLSENYMMMPQASIASFIFQGESLRYFNVGKLSLEQLKKIGDVQNMSEDTLINNGLKLREDIK